MLSAQSAKRSAGSGADRHGGRGLSLGSPRSNIALECSEPSTKEKPDSEEYVSFCVLAHNLVAMSRAGPK